MNRPQGAEAEKFLERWDTANRDSVAKAALLREYKVSHRCMRGWAETIRIELDAGYDLERVVKSTHRNQFVKETSNPTILSLKMQGTMAVINDAQHPFHDKMVLNLIRKFLKRLQPEYLVFNGDWWDFYQWSQFDQNPDRLDELQTDIDMGIYSLRQFRDDLQDTKLILTDGNHEDRLRRMLWRKNPELLSLRCLNPDELLGLIDLEIDHIPKHQILEVNGIFKVEHGDVISKHSGWTAKAMFEKRGGNGICGHSHRGGSYYKHDSDYYGWWENFCTCSLYPEYAKNPNWMQGFSLIHFKDGRFDVEQMPIIKGKFMYGGELFE